jgi:hypothetical protein
VCNKTILALVICSFLILLVPSASAERTVKVAEGYISFLSETTDISKENIIKFNPPDGISEIIDMQVMVKGDFAPLSEISVMANNMLCKPDSWTIPSQKADLESKMINYMVVFDCTKNMEKFKGGNIPIEIRTGKSAIPSQNLVGTYKITYYNNPTVALTDISMNLHGTEYETGDNGTVFLQLLNENRLPINNALCYIDIYFPNKTVFIDNDYMMYLLGSDGLYFYDVAIPNTVGVYMLSARCNFYHNVTYSPSMNDSYVASSSPNSNYGNFTYMVAGRTGFSPSYGHYYSFAKFNLTNMGTNINNAILFLYDGSSFSAITNVKRVITSWGEKNVTWNNKPSAGSQIYDTKSNAGYGWFSYNITKLVKGWANGSFANNGLQLNYTNATGTWFFSSFYTKEYGLGYEPRLIVTMNTTVHLNEIRGSGELHVSPKFNVSCNINATNIENMIKNTNTTIMSKLYGVQGELKLILNNETEIINLITSMNTSIIDLIYGINETLYWAILNNRINISNFTAIFNTSEIPKQTYMYFETIEERLIHNHDYCISNSTVHRKELLTEKCVFGDCFNITKNIDEVCSNGCADGACLPTPVIKYSLFIVAIILMLSFMYGVYLISRRM